MFRGLLLFALAAMPVLAQDSRSIVSVRGVVVADEPLAGNRLLATLVDSSYHKEVARSYVGADGSFLFRDVPPGSYTVELSASGEAIERQTVSLNSSSDQIEIRLPAAEKKPSGSGKVSVRELQQPLSRKSKKIFEAAQKASAAGDHAKEVEILRGSLNDPAAAPYARMNIGVAYLRSGQLAAGIPELREAVRLMPENPVARTNLAYALLLTKSLDEAEAECRRSLALDSTNAKTRWIMGSTLLAKGSHDEEAVQNLQLASREFPAAKVVLAHFYERSGQRDAAAQELREFLPRASGAEKTNVEQWLLKLAPK